MNIHPIAALFPMMSKDELSELADDIKENGQREAIKLSADGKTLIDGRNRLAACKLAGVEPKFEHLNGEDTEAYVISANIARRHMTHGQRAMVVAKIHPEPEDVGRGKKGLISKHFPMVSSATLSLARKILKHVPDKVNGVVDGSIAFEVAVRLAKESAENASSTESKMKMLREGARDLADLVKDERMDIDEAIAGLRERERKEREIIEHGKQAADAGLTQFVMNVNSIAAAVKATDEKILDKKKLAQVARAHEHLQSLFK